jgi:hypothetical protein
MVLKKKMGGYGYHKAIKVLSYTSNLLDQKSEAIVKEWKKLKT